MKGSKILPAAILMTCALAAHGQGTIQFQAVLTGQNEVPPNNDPTLATANLTLNGNSLSFLVFVPAVTFTAMSGSINGPALPGENGPLLFDLGGPKFHSGNSFGLPPSYSFGSPSGGPIGAGPFTLSDLQIAQLESGSWYMDITSFQMPNGQIRGQIVAVPEPSSIALWGLGISLLVFSLQRKRG